MTDRPGRDAEATRLRLLLAARDEFAQYGIAGARVDRIALTSRSNKAQIYHYYGSKDGLFDAVFGLLVDDVLREVPMDVADLPDYAARLHDGYAEHQEVYRLATWHRLERGDGDLIEAVLDSNAVKIAEIAEAQAAGIVSRSHAPEAILGFILHTAALWSAQTPEYLHQTAHLDPAARRALVVDAVRAVTTPEPVPAG